MLLRSFRAASTLTLEHSHPCSALGSAFATMRCCVGLRPIGRPPMRRQMWAAVSIRLVTVVPLRLSVVST